MADNELFRTTLVGGYDKDDVEKHIQKMKDEAYVNKNRLLQILKQRDQTIQELNEKLDEKDAQLRQKDRDIKEKYQAYIDNYEQIGRLVYESRVRADRMIIDAREESRRIIQEARNLAKRRLDQVQEQIDDKLEEGRVKHQAIQKELDGLLELLKEVRKRCLSSYDNVEFLVNSYTEQEDPFADILAELEGSPILSESSLSDEPTFQEQISYMKSQLDQEVYEEEETLDEADSLDDLEPTSDIRHELEDDDDEEPADLPEIHVMSVEEVLKSIDEQQAALAAAKAGKTRDEEESGAVSEEEISEEKASEEEAAVEEEVSAEETPASEKAATEADEAVSEEE